MKTIKTSYGYIMRLNKGEGLVSSLARFAKEKHIGAAWINGLGAVTSVELGYYDLDNQTYHWKIFNKTLEITSLSGNITSQDNQPTVHAHGTFSDESYQTVAGHIKEATIGGTCELMIATSNNIIVRARDDETGLNLMQL